MSTSSPWDQLSGAYCEHMPISEDVFHLGPNGAPLDLNDYRLAIGPHTRVLDLGCGAGHNSRALASRCAVVDAVDASKRQIDRARCLTDASNIRYFHSDVRNFLAASPPESYDFVFSIFCLEYLPDLAAVFTQIQRVLAPSGRLLYCDLHPFASAADVVAVTPAKFLATLSYFSEGARPFIWSLGAMSAELVRHHRTFATVLDAALQARLHLVSISEPPILAEGEGSPYEDATIGRQACVWSKVPYTLVLLFGSA